MISLNFLAILSMGNSSCFRYFGLKTLFQALYIVIKPGTATMGAHKGKTLKLQLFKKLWKEIFEILDLSSPNTRKK